MNKSYPKTQRQAGKNNEKEFQGDDFLQDMEEEFHSDQSWS